MKDCVMSFGHQTKKFSNLTQEKLQQMSAAVEASAAQKLREILGEDVALIKGGVYEKSLGKFHSIVAPQSVIDRLRDAGVLED